MAEMDREYYKEKMAVFFKQAFYCLKFFFPWKRTIHNKYIYKYNTNINTLIKRPIYPIMRSVIRVQLTLQFIPTSLHEWTKSVSVIPCYYKGYPKAICVMSPLSPESPRIFRKLKKFKVSSRV